MIFVNGYFRSQAVTGQQRFANEIADRLLRLVPGARELRPTPSSSRRREWAELQTRVPVQARAGTLLSLTARTPFLAKRHIVTVHDLFPLTNPEWFSSRYARLHGALLTWHLAHAAGIVVVSEPVRDQVAERCRVGMPVVVAPNAAVPWTCVEAEDNEDRKSFPGTEGFFLTVGSLEPRKNLRRLIEAHGQLPPRVQRDFPLVVVGGTADAFSDRLADIGSSRTVRFVGRVSDGELAALYRQCSAFVSVSLGEGFGLPVIEAASLLTGSLVLSDIAAYRWLASEVGPQFVDPLSTASIAAGLLAALESQVDAFRLEALTRRFSWDRSAESVVAFLREAGS